MNSKTLSLETIINELDFLKKRVIIERNAWKKKEKDSLLLANKLIENILDPRNAKEHCQLFLVKKNRNSVKQLEIITYQPRTFQNPEIVDIKLVITEHPKTSHKLSKTIG